MSIRAKLLLVFILLGIVPMLLLSVGYYRSGARAVEQLLRADVADRAAHVTSELNAQLAEREADLSELARQPALLAYLHAQPTAATLTAGNLANAEDASAALGSLLRTRPGDFAAITLVGADRRPRARVEPPGAGNNVVVVPAELLPASVPLDERVWATNEARLLRSPIIRGPFGAGLRYTVPLFPSAAHDALPVGAIVADLKLDALFNQLEAAPAVADDARGRARAEPQRITVVLDHDGQLVYHTNRALKYQAATSALPGFAAIARAMTTGAHGAESFTANDGQRWLTAYQPVAGLDLSVAVAGNETAAAAGLQLFGTAGLVLTVLSALAVCIVMTVVVARTTRRINRVAEAAAEIAAGNLEQRINVQSTDETRLLADSFNLMSDRLREHIAREAESKQFQSFLRLSAMLTHDLKNSITGLSMLVNNMERHLDRAEFRADAISSLRAATDKLRALVARLNEPARTLSGEYRQAIRPTDLVPLIKRVFAATAEPAAAIHQLETHLPDTLVAPVDAERIERVVENLILNALEALGARSGRLTVAAGALDEWHVFISVRDTGAGMTEEFIRTRLFRPFATTKERGIGLGLYTCREIVTAHGGRLEVESELRAGTCFRAVLPSTPVTERNQTSALRSQQPTDAKTIRSVDQAPQ